MHTLLLPLLLLFGYLAPSPAPIELKGYFRCRGVLMDGTGDALTCYAPTQRDCNAGTVILAFEKRRSQPGEKAVFAIVDTVQVRAAAPRRVVEITRCNAAGKSRQYFVVFDAAASGAQAHLSHLARAWGVNAQDHLAPVAVKSIQCMNEDFMGD